MQTEFEAKFFVDVEKIQQKLQDLGAVCVRNNGLMRRYVFDVPGKDSHWLRVRDENEYVTLALKSYKPDGGIESVKELEMKVSNFDVAVLMLETLGYTKSLYVQNYREIWNLHDCLIMIDRWPGLDPFVEIEGLSKQSVHAVAALLGFDMQHAMYGPNRLLYEQRYGISAQEFQATKILTFQHLPDWVKK